MGSELRQEGNGTFTAFTKIGHEMDEAGSPEAEPLVGHETTRPLPENGTKLPEKDPEIALATSAEGAPEKSPTSETDDGGGTPWRCRGRLHWGYMVVLASFVSNFFVVGFGYSCGLYYLEWMDYFEGSNSSEISWIGSINLGLLGLAGPLAAYLSARFGDRVVVMTAAAVASVGLVSSAFVYNVYLMMFTFGFVTGFGFSLTHVSMATVPMFFFNERRAGPALGVAMSGGACGSFILPVLIGKLVSTFGWRGSLIILGGLNLNCCVCGALLRPSKRMPKRSDRTPIFDVKILRNVSFVLFLFAQILFSMGLSAVYIHIAALVESLTKVSREKSGAIISVIGIANFLGRNIHGVIGGMKSVDILSQYNISYILTGAALFVLPHVPMYAACVTFAAMFGFLIAPYVTLSQPIMVKLIGLENLKIGFGLFIFMSGVGLITGAPMAGFLYDVTGDYVMSMYFGGATILGCVVFMAKPWVDATCRGKVEREAVIVIENCDKRTSI